MILVVLAAVDALELLERDSRAGEPVELLQVVLPRTRRGTIHHFDLWRLDGPGALAELGWDDALRDIVVVEWPDRLGELRPSDALTVRLAAGNARYESGANGCGIPRGDSTLVRADV